MPFAPLRRLLEPAAAVLAVMGLLAVAPVFASGIGGDAPPTRIPVPAAEFSAWIEDTSGTRIKLDRVTFNGEVYVYGDLGEGQATVPFARIRDVVFRPDRDASDRVLATATIDNGEQVTVAAQDDVLLYGLAVFGNYQIPIDRIRRLEVVHP